MRKTLPIVRRLHYRIVCFAIAGLLAQLSVASSATDFPGTLKPYTADYTVRAMGMNVAAMHYQLSQQESQLFFSITAQPKGLAKLMSSVPIIEKSVLEWNNNQLRPMQYSRKHTGKKDAKIQDLQISYDYDLGQATVTSANAKHDVEIDAGLWDDASLILAIMVDLGQEHTELNYRLIDDAEGNEHQYIVAGTVLIDTALGERKAIKITRDHGSRQTIMWFAPEQNFLLLKMQQYRKGKLKSEVLLKSFVDDSAPS